MWDLALYLGMAVIGYFIGSRMRNRLDITGWTSRIQTAAITLLIFTMGLRMGSNRNVMTHLNTIGLSAFIMTVAIMVCSALSITILRKFLKIDRFGRIEGDMPFEEEEREAEEKEHGLNVMTVIILISVAVGMLCGYFAVGRIFDDMDHFDAIAGNLIVAGLCLLLAFVGFDMGLEGTVIQNFKKVGVRVLAFPFTIMIGTLVGAFVCSIFLPLSTKESLAIGAGFGWYSLAPVIIMDNGLVTASAVSFMHNIMREYLSVLLIPLVAEKVGYLESISLSGCSSMDVCLPLVEKATRSDIAMYSFISGAIQSLAVPILVPLILG